MNILSRPVLTADCVHIRKELAFVLALLTLSAAAQQTLSITHVTVIDTVTGKTQANTTVMIQGNRITGIGSSTSIIPKAGQIVDARGEYLIPGLWDMHTHVYFDSTAADGTDLVLPLLLANGITGVRDMGSKLDEVLEARDQIAAHRLLGPRMVVSGPMLDGPKSTYKAVIPIATPADGRKAVDMLKSRGVDFIKVQSGVPREAYFAIAEESKKVGIPFEGHVPDAVRASEAVAAGQVTFEHLIGIFEASSPDEDKYLTGKKTVGMSSRRTIRPVRQTSFSCSRKTMFGSAQRFSGSEASGWWMRSTIPKTRTWPTPATRGSRSNGLRRRLRF